MTLTFGGRLVGFVLPPALAGAVVTTIVPPRQLTILPSTKILALVDWDVVTVVFRLGTPTALVVVDRERVGGRRGQGDNSQRAAASPPGPAPITATLSVISGTVA